MEYYTYGQQASTHQPSLLYSGGQSVSSGIHVSPPSQMDTGGYLPPFLLGSPAAKSPSRLRGGSQVSTGLTPGVQGLRRSTATGLGSAIDRSHFDGIGKLDGGGSGVKTVGGPPVHGLYDHHSVSPPKASTPLLRGSPERRQLNFSVVTSGARGAPSSSSTALGSAVRPRANSTPGNISSLSLKQRTPPSPPQMDPFYTQGDQLTSEDDYYDCWITVFGFPSTAASFILEQFSQYGTILKHIVTSNGNWMHILYQSRLQAKKALSKNGKVFGNGIMVGVQQCIDKSIVEGYSEGRQGETVDYSSSSSAVGVTAPSTPGKRPTSIRPLTAAYQASASQHQVALMNPNTPQKSSGFFAKAFEYMFGW